MRLAYNKDDINTIAEAILDNVTKKPKLNIIKKYANRKFYSTKLGRYVNLSEVERLVTGDNVKVIDNKTKNDITTNVIGSIVAQKLQDKPQLNRAILDYVNNVLEGV